MRINTTETAPPNSKAKEIIHYCLERFKEKGDQEALNKIDLIDNHVKDGYKFIGLTSTGMYRYIKVFKEGYQKTIAIDATEADAYRACVEHAVETDVTDKEYRKQRIKNQADRDEKLKQAVAVHAHKQKPIGVAMDKINEVVEKLDLKPPVES